MKQFTVIGAIEERTLLRFLHDPDTGAEGLRLLVHSTGGDVSVCSALVDILSPLRRDGMLETLAMGEVASAAPLLVACGSPGKRMSLPNCCWGLHEPYLEVAGAVTGEAAKELQMTKDRFYNLLTQLTGRRQRFWRDRMTGGLMYWFNAKEAQKMGLCDLVL